MAKLGTEIVHHDTSPIIGQGNSHKMQKHIQGDKTKTAESTLTKLGTS